MTTAQSREQLRLRTVLSVAGTRARVLHDATDERELHVIPVLPDDTTAYLLARLDEAECPAVLVMTVDGAPRVVALRPVDLNAEEAIR
jgi:hypothetical protein